jgi:hypothetical protein
VLLALFACAPPPPPPNPGADVTLAARWEDGITPRGTARGDHAATLDLR